MTGIDNESKEVPKPVEKAPKKTPTRKPKKIKNKKKRKDFKFNPLLLIPFVAVVVLIVVALCVKSCNKATDKPSAETTSSIKEVVTTTANQTQPVSIQSVTIPAQATVSVATVAADNTQPATAAIAIRTTQKKKVVSRARVEIIIIKATTITTQMIIRITTVETTQVLIVMLQ